MAIRMWNSLVRSLAALALALAPSAQGPATPLGPGRGPVSRVAYVADERANDVFELFTVPTDGSAAPLVVSGTLTTGGDVSLARAVSRGRVLYLADALTDGVFELFVVPSDASAAPLRLSAALIADGDVSDFRAVGEDVIYRADAVVADRDELFRVPLDGSAPPVALAPGLDVYRMYALSPDGGHLLFGTYEILEERLRVVPLDGSTPPRDLAGSGIPTGFAISFFLQVEWTGDGQRVVFERCEDDDSFVYSELWSVRRDGAGLVQLNPGPRFEPTQFRLAPDGSRVVYEDADVNLAYHELISTRTDGTSWRLLTPGAGDPGPFRISDDSSFCVFALREAGKHGLRLDRLDGSLPLELLAPRTGSILELELVEGSTTTVFLQNGSVYSLATPGVALRLSGVGHESTFSYSRPFFRFPAPGLVLYRNDETSSGGWELFSAPIDGSAPARRLCPALPGDRDVGLFLAAPDRRVVYVSDQGVNERFELFGVPLDGSSPALQLNGPLASDRDVGSVAEPVPERRALRRP